MAEGDVDLGAFLDKYATPPPTPDPEKLPERKAARTTYYYPATPEATRAAGLSYAMEGGIHGGGKFGDIDLREHTLEKFQQGKTDWVAVAMHGIPTGEKFRTTTDKGEPFVARNVDTGGGLRPGQHDIATEDPQKAKTGGGGVDIPLAPPGPSAAMQIAMEEPPAKAAETPAAPPSGGGGGGGGFTPTPIPQLTPPAKVNLPQIPMDSGMTPTPPIPTTPQDIDLGAFLASRTTPTPTPQPTETPAPTQDIDLGQFLASRVSPHELPQAGGMAPVSKLGTAVGEFAKSQLPEVMPSLQSQVVGMMPPPVQMAVSGAGLGRENYEALQQPLGSQAQYNVAVKDVAAFTPLVAPAVGRLLGSRGMAISKVNLYEQA